MESPAPPVLAPSPRWLPPVWVLPPGPDALDRAIASQRGEAFTYPDVGATADHTPHGWRHDAGEVALGTGPEVYAAAVAALRAWRMFELSWVRLRAAGPPEEGRTVAFASSHLGLWVVNCCRVVYVEEVDDGPVRQVAFAYGTLPWHAVRGEERFEVRWDTRTDQVWFALSQFSVPSDVLTRLFGSYARGVQRTFVRDALAAMQAAVS